MTQPFPKPILSNDKPLKTDPNDPYELVIIGSGYGGSIPAARMAEALGEGKVCVLERGREYPLGSYPDTTRGVTKALYHPTINPLGLYEIDTSEDVSVLHASGLGGTSLINFNAALRPDREVFQHDWPKEITDAAKNLDETKEESLWHWYKKAEYNLEVHPWPDIESTDPAKGGEGTKSFRYRATNERAAQIGLPVKMINVTINYKEKQDTQPFPGTTDKPQPGMERKKCINCGDCGTGCNVGAKNTLYLTYLPRAKKHGAHIFTQIEVDHVEKVPGKGWLVHAKRREIDPNTGQIKASGVSIPAKRVIVAAGTVGTNGILLRSRHKSASKSEDQATWLKFSERLGFGFHDNGDFFGMSYNGDKQTDVVGWGNHADDDGAGGRPFEPLRKLNVGAAIVSQVKYKADDPVLNNRFQFQDMAFPPRGYRNPMGLMLQSVKNAINTDPDKTPEHQFAALRRRLRDIGGFDQAGSNEVEPGGLSAADGALNHSMFYLVMVHRPADYKALGRIILDPSDYSTPKVVWPTPGADPIFEKVNSEALRYAEAQKATFLPLNMWQFSPYKSLFTAHPLGGCPMGSSGSYGVVDHRGRVFTGNGTEVHDGLYVTDGAIIPRTLGANPLLTLTALAERFSKYLIDEMRDTGYSIQGPKASW